MLIFINHTSTNFKVLLQISGAEHINIAYCNHDDRLRQQRPQKWSTTVPKQHKTETENDTLCDSIIYYKDNVQSCVDDVETVNTELGRQTTNNPKPL